MKAKFLAAAMILMLSGASGQLWAQSTAKQDDIKRLLGIIGARASVLRVSTQVIEGARRSNKDIPEAVWQEIYDEAEARIDAFVTEKLVPIYDQYLTHENIKGLIAFYQSSLGEKLLSVMPQMSQESMMAGRLWGREFAEAVQKRLAEKGYK